MLFHTAAVVIFVHKISSISIPTHVFSRSVRPITTKSKFDALVGRLTEKMCYYDLILHGGQTGNRRTERCASVTLLLVSDLPGLARFELRHQIIYRLVRRV